MAGIFTALTMFKSGQTKAEKEVAVLSDSIDTLENDSKRMGQALVVLNGNAELIDNTIDTIKEADFTQAQDYINGLDLEDEYKKNLIKELDSTKEQAISTLSPIREASEKIRGNMAVSSIKYQMITRTLEIKKNVIESGTVQVESIKKVEELGAFSADKINELIKQAEDINNMTKDAVDNWKLGSNKINKLANKEGNTFDVFAK